MKRAILPILREQMGDREFWVMTGIAVFITVLFVAVLIASFCARASEVVAGWAYVLDGDTVEVQGVRVRLKGIAAPELDEPGGAVARAFLKQLAAQDQFGCVLTGERSHDRKVGHCYLNLSFQDVGALAVHAGVARDCPRYSDAHYRAAELTAAASGATISRWYQLPEYCR